MSEHARVERMLDRMREHWVSAGRSIQDERDAFQALGRQFPEPDGVDESLQPFGDVPTYVSHPHGTERARCPVVLYMHGGAFLIGSTQIYRYQSSLIAKRAGAIVISVDYRLAPEHPFPAAPDDCLAAYRGLIDSGIDPHRVVLAGDSAGGNLALGVSQRMRDAGENLPAGLALISPWVDLTCSADSMDTNANPRHLAQRSGLLASARAYLNGEDPTTPLASPLHGDLSGLSPVLIQVGGSETLLDESVQLENALAQQGTSAQLQIFNGMVHEWHLLSALLDPDDELEGATKAIDDMADFIIGVAA